MNAAEVLRRKGSEVISIRPDAPVQEAVKTLVSHGVGSLLVRQEGGQIVGILSERDILRVTAQRFDRLSGMLVEEVMTRDVIVGLITDEVDDIESVMTDRRIRHLPIMDGGKLAGIVSIGDVVKARRKRAEIAVRHLTDYITGQYPA